MTNPASPFSSLEYFREQFNQGLHDLLLHQKLGTFILVLANATQHKNLFHQLHAKLLEQFNALKENYQNALLNGSQLNEVEEDLLVFLKIATIGFENIQLTQIRKQDHWQYQFNHIRSFRPRRMSSFQYASEISIPYDENGFNFNKPFMAKECFWEGQLRGKQIDLFYNKYPFADLHGLFVPERKACMPQLLTQELNEYMWQVTEELSNTLPGLGFGYNSYGAYASVNHLHFQMFIELAGLPITSGHWKHNGGNESYPINVIKTYNVHEAWQTLNELHIKNQPYNALYIKNEMYIISRKVQGSVDVPEWSSGFTWAELCGGLLMFNQDDYLNLSNSEVTELFGFLKK